jgi:hypothetical protein
MHGLYDVDRPHFELPTHRDTRGHSLKVNKGHCRLNVRSNFFSQYVVNLWNSLPESTIMAPTLNSFKFRLDNHWRDVPTLYDPSCLQ